MRILAFPVTVLLFLLWPGLSSADSFYTDLGSHLTALGLPATDSTIGENGGFGDSEDTALNSFWLVSTTGQASKNVVSVTGLPFEKALRVQSQTAPDETWHHRIAQFVGGTWKTGDTGLLVFSVHSVASEGSPIMKAAITSTDTVTTLDNAGSAVCNADLTLSPQWQTVYVPFTAPGDLHKGLLTFYFGYQRQTLEIGGIAVFNFGSAVTLSALKAAIPKLPGAQPSTAEASPATSGTPPTHDPNALVQKIQGELSGFPLAESKPDPAVPQGDFFYGVITDSHIYPGTQNEFQVYVPAEYDPAKPACLLLKLDGLTSNERTVLDNLIAKKEIPIIIAVGVSPGSIWKDPPGTPDRRALRFNRSYEFDSVNDHFPDYVLNELLPTVEKLKTRDGRAINLSPDGNDHAVTGLSTGGIGSFTLAWRRPDQFRRVYTIIGTFVSMRGGHDYPALIRKTDPKPIRMFLEDGSTDAWNPLFGSWFTANLNMESALTFSGYDVAHAWGTHGHDAGPGSVIFPDVMRWLWRDYPKPITAGVSRNSTLQEITIPNEGWEKIPQTFQAATGLASNAQGEVYFSDAPATTLYRVGDDGEPVAAIEHAPKITGQAFGPDGTLYAVVPGEKTIVAFDPQHTRRTVATGIAGHGIVVTHDGTLYVSEPGEHSDMPSQIWRINSTGEKDVIDQGLSSASGVAFSPDGSLFFAAENSTQWIYSYVVQPDGSLADKQSYYWLHTTDIPNNSGAEDLAVDTKGDLYVATRMGIQVCDQNGRVRAILPLPTPCGPVRSVCFGGEHRDFLYVTDGTQVFKRRLKITGFAPWSAPAPYPSQGPG